MSWLAQAIVETKGQREDRAVKQAASHARSNEIEAAKESTGLKQLTVEQANSWIDSQLDGASTTAQKLEAIRTIFKKMVPYLLD